MRPKSFILLILALGCGLIAAVGINQVLANRGKQVVVQAGETESIFVVMADVEPGARLTPEVLKLEPWPKDKIPSGAILELDDVEGRRTRTRLFAGEPILQAKLFNSNGSDNPATIRIPIGFRVESFKVDAVASGSNLIVPGDRVDVMVYLKKDTSRGIDATGIRTILQNVSVFAINDRYKLEPGEAEEGSIQAKTVSLLLLPDQAQLLHLASELGKIRLALRSPEDEDILTTQTTSVDELFRTTGDSSRDDERLYTEPTDVNLTFDQPDQVASAVDPRIIAHRMVMIEGTERWEQVFDEDGRPLAEPPSGQVRSHSDTDLVLPDDFGGESDADDSDSDAGETPTEED